MLTYFGCEKITCLKVMVVSAVPFSVIKLIQIQRISSLCTLFVKLCVQNDDI